MKQYEFQFHQTKKIEDLLKTAIIVVDTNVLLSAYQWRNVTVEEVLNVLENLSNQDRLKIPEQVIKEFSKNRPDILRERINEIETILSSNFTKEKPLNQRAPMLEGQQIFKDTDELLANYNKAQSEYKKGLIKIRDKIKEIFTFDPYLVRLNKILEKSFYNPIEISDEKIYEEAQERFSKKIPPGYKDDGKEENNAGDYVIWKSILQIQKDVIFISNDKKVDWVYNDKQGEPISARRELVEEFYEKTGGKDFIYLSPKEFISLYNPQVSTDIKEDLRKESFSDFENWKPGPKLMKLVRQHIEEILKDHNPIPDLNNVENFRKYFEVAKDISLACKYTDDTNENAESIMKILIKYNEGKNPEIRYKEFYSIVNEIEDVLRKLRYSGQIRIGPMTIA